MNTFGLHTFAIAPVWDLARIEPQIERLKEYGIGLLEIPLLRPEEIDTKRTRAFGSRTSLAAAAEKHMSSNPEWENIRIEHIHPLKSIKLQGDRPSSVW